MGKRVVFFTISPNPKLGYVQNYVDRKVKTKRSITYDNLTHPEQHAYLTAYLREVYAKHMSGTDWMYYIFETNESNNLHIHGFMFLDGPCDDYELKAMRKTIYCEPMTQLNINKKAKKSIDYMNNIVYLEKDRIDEKVEYLFKEDDIKTVFPDQFINIDNIKPPQVLLKNKDDTPLLTVTVG